MGLVRVDYEGRFVEVSFYLAVLQYITDTDLFPFRARPQDRMQTCQQGAQLFLLAVFFARDFHKNLGLVKLPAKSPQAMVSACVS